MTNPVWAWVVKNDLTPFAFDVAPDSGAACWCYGRYGQSQTTLPDGRIIQIGGEYEDWYDPDFYIYNDVVVRDPSGTIDVYGYPEAVFPPTDFHTATLAGDKIVLIGNLSYPRLRGEQTQVCVLDTSTLEMRPISASGENPDWLHGHSAELEPGGSAIRARGGKISNRRWPFLVENIEDWRIDLTTWRWERLTRRNWRRYAFFPADRRENCLAALRSLISSRKPGQRERMPDGLSGEQRLDLIAALYAPPVPHSTLPAIEDEYHVHRIAVGGVTVRYVEDRVVTMTVEGALPEATVEVLRANLHNKLEQIAEKPFECTRIEQ